MAGGVTPTQTITGNENVDQNAQLEQLLNTRLGELEANLTKQMHGQNPASVIPDQNTTPTPIKLVIHGKEFQFRDHAEASRAVEDAMAQTQQMTAAQFADKQPQNTPATPAAAVPGFNREQFAEMIEKDPSKGIEYALGHMIFGRDVPNAGSVIRGALEEVQKLRQVNAVQTFRNTVPGFKGTQNEVDATEQIRRELNLPTDNPVAWEAAFSIAKNRGLIPSDAPAAQAPSYTQHGGLNLPPSMTREPSAPTASWVRRAENLPADQLEKFLNEISSGARVPNS